MSYCRFSCDDFSSDVCVYHSIGGVYVIHVATNRRIFQEPLPPKLPDNCKPMEWVERHMIVMGLAEKAITVPIELPYDGQDFSYMTAEETLEKLLDLQETGYHVPEHAIQRLQEEVKEEQES